MSSCSRRKKKKKTGRGKRRNKKSLKIVSTEWVFYIHFTWKQMIVDSEFERWIKRNKNERPEKKINQHHQERNTKIRAEKM